MPAIANPMSTETAHFMAVPLLSPSEIEDLLKKLARGHISTMQEEYAALKKVLVMV